MSNQREFRIKSFYGQEEELLMAFKTLWKIILANLHICSVPIMEKNLTFPILPVG